MKKTLQKNPFLYFLLCSLLFIGLVGCDNDKDDDGIRNDKDKCNCVNPEGVEVDANGCAIIDSISHIRIYIDASASMQGYFNKNADGKGIIDKINTALKVDTLFKEPEIWILGDSLKQFIGNAEDLSNYIVQQRFADNKSSKLHVYLKQILDKHQPSDISLFFTDNILSYSDNEIKASENREINKNNIEILSSRVKEVFSLAKNKIPISASIYGFPSQFYGRYFNYKNLPVDFFNGVGRPFYCWAIANKKNVQKFEQKIDILYPTPIPHVNFGTTFEVVDKCFISSSIEQDGSAGYVIEENYTKISDIDMDQLPIRIPIALNLTSLPSYAKENEYLMSHLKLEPSQGLTAQLMGVKSSKDIDISQIKSPKTQEKFKENTHVILVDIGGIDTKNATLQLTMPVMYDWYEQWNTMDDTNTDSLKNKTFGLSYLIGGLRETYEMKNTHYIQLNFTLNR